ncbi:hypothetical protein V6N11_059576 [Hibiscus sabdariffa]|uniref:Uncharacterized protein n=1 Tax=Hibiscus sabdariffa TaxID=183260 RepID=A0ABR2NP58_9ROSI
MPGSVNSHAGDASFLAGSFSISRSSKVYQQKGKGPPITYGSLLKDEVTSPHPFRSTPLPVLSHNGVKERVFVDSCLTHSVEGDTTTAADASLNIQPSVVINRVENMSSAGFNEMGTPSQQQHCPSISNNVQGSRMDGSGPLQDSVANSSPGTSVLPVANIQHELSQVGNSQQDAQAYDSSQQTAFQLDAIDADPQGANSVGGPSTSHFEDVIPSQVVDTFISHANASSSHENTNESGKSRGAGRMLRLQLESVEML